MNTAEPQTDFFEDEIYFLIILFKKKQKKLAFVQQKQF